VIYLLDTNAFSDLLRENPKSREKISNLSPEDSVIISSVVRGEIRYGIEKLAPGKKRSDIEMKSNNLFASFLCHPISDKAADLYGKIKAAVQGKGLSLDENDLWIAATTLSLDATLVTRDSDFHRVEGLKTTDWTR
jgi:tRNA(fMet)-specific endonuclease VapC